MKNIKQLKDEVAVLNGWDSFDAIHSKSTEKRNMLVAVNIANKACELFEQQYIDRVKELEDCLKCMLSLSMAQGSSKEWFEIIEANRLLKK